MVLSKRELIKGCTAVALLPAAACRAAAAAGELTPESFGAVGDGFTDDYDAFRRMAAAVGAAGGGTVMLQPGRTYLLDRYVTAGNGVSDIVFQGCSRLAIEGNGATISTKGDYYRDARSTRGLAGLRFEDCGNVQLRNLQLTGNVQLTRRAAGIAEAPSHGLVFGGCSDVLVDNVLARHFAGDGLYIRASNAAAAGTFRASRRFAVSNSRFLFNARQGLSVIQLRDGTFDNCEFSYTGYVAAPGTTGPYGSHAPSSGVDIEPNFVPFGPHPVDVLTGNLTFRGCRLIGNLGAALTAGQVKGNQSTMENVVLDGCTVRASDVSPLRYGIIFDVPGGRISGCTLELGDKTVFIGWYPQSGASPVFSNNRVSGTGTGPSHALLIVRPTRGAPLVERNRFVASRSAGSALQVGNPKAIARANEVLKRP